MDTSQLLTCGLQFLSRLVGDLLTPPTPFTPDVGAIIQHGQTALNTFEANKPTTSLSEPIINTAKCVTNTLEMDLSNIVENIITSTIIIFVIVLIIGILFTAFLLYSAPTSDSTFISTSTYDSTYSNYTSSSTFTPIYTIILLFILLTLPLVAIFFVFRSISNVNINNVDKCRCILKNQEEIFTFQFFQAINSALCAY